MAVEPIFCDLLKATEVTLTDYLLTELLDWYIHSTVESARLHFVTSSLAVGETKEKLRGAVIQIFTVLGTPVTSSPVTS